MYHEAPRNVVFSIPLLSRPFQAQSSSSAPWSRNPSAYIQSVFVIPIKLQTLQTRNVRTYNV